MKKNIFGTDGIRARFGVEPFTPNTLATLGRAIGQWASSRYGKNPRILIGMDTRESGPIVTSAVETGLMMHGITVHHTGVLPTPAIQQVIKNSSDYDLGIAITASHNPYHDNGIKITDARVGKLEQEDEEAITQIFHTINDHGYENENLGNVLYVDKTQEYITTILEHFADDLLVNTKIVLDCANGATHKVAPHIFEKLGAQVIQLNSNPDGKNINHQCGATDTKTLQKVVIEQKADAGFAFDGDGDRLMAVSKDGVGKDGDDFMAILLSHPKYNQTKTVVGTIMANKGLEDHLSRQGKTLARTAVGDRNVSRFIEENNLVLGGEQSGHVILADYLQNGDGIFAALRVLETLKLTNNWEMKSFTRYPQTATVVPAKTKKNLNKGLVQEIIQEHSEKLPNGRLIVRYSGTEPVLRIMAEDADGESAKLVCDSLASKLVKELA